MVFKKGLRWDSLEFYKQTGLRIGFLSFLVKDICYLGVYQPQ